MTVPLIGLAHGSRHPAVSESIDRLLAQVGRAESIPTRSAYLDLTAPDLGEVVADLARDHTERAVVVPLLFTRAFHATVDVPQSVRAAAEAYGLQLVTAGILGTGDDVLRVVAEAAADAGVQGGDSVLLFSVGSSDQLANMAVIDLAERWAATRPSAVRAGFGTTTPRGAQIAAELAELGTRVAVVPLFVSPGLLLDPIARLAAKRGWLFVPPLGTRLAPLVLQRYRDALTGGDVRG